ncbi:hypothetical protein M9H77_16534 [Catharanthus roseus]|uniref:Uncharacterized protein n=1 Tax=Catharanthus roseus TaxID=4058 RepID=A0ACC0B224_CATRO|nr:hypothetical protein M9H77_16534 [Catharanthus roseus]
MLGSVTLDLNPVDKGHSTIRGLDPKWYCISLLIMLCGSGYFQAGWVRRGSLARTASPVLRGTQIPYPAAVDLAEGYGVSHFSFCKHTIVLIALALDVDFNLDKFVDCVELDTFIASLLKRFVYAQINSNRCCLTMKIDLGGSDASQQRAVLRSVDGGTDVVHNVLDMGLDCYRDVCLSVVPGFP